MTFPMSSFIAHHKGYQLSKGVSYNGAFEATTPSLYCADIIRKRTIFTGTANHLRGKEWVVTSNWTAEIEQELDALSHQMLMAAINSQLPSVLEYLDKCRCTLQLTQAFFMHFHKFDSKLPPWLCMHVLLRLQLSNIVRDVSNLDRKKEKIPSGQVGQQ